MRKLSSWYLGYGLVVGGLLFLLLLVGTQAARSTTEALLAIPLGLVDPMPTLLLGIALRRGWRVAPALCAIVPVVMTLIVARVWGQPEPGRDAGLFTSVMFNAQYGQLYFLPCVVPLGLIVAARAIWSGRRRDEIA